MPRVRHNFFKKATDRLTSWNTAISLLTYPRNRTPIAFTYFRNSESFWHKLSCSGFTPLMEMINRFVKPRQSLFTPLGTMTIKSLSFFFLRFLLFPAFYRVFFLFQGNELKLLLISQILISVRPLLVIIISLTMIAIIYFLRLLLQYLGVFYVCSLPKRSERTAILKLILHRSFRV